MFDRIFICFYLYDMKILPSMIYWHLVLDGHLDSLPDV